MYSSNFSNYANNAILRAFDIARQSRHAHVGPEHLLVALCMDDNTAARVLVAMGVSADDVVRRFEELYPQSDGLALRSLRETPELKQVIARTHKVASGVKKCVWIDDLLRSLISCQPDVLRAFGIDPKALEKIRQATMKGAEATYTPGHIHAPEVS